MSAAEHAAKFSAQAVWANPKLLLHKAFDETHPQDLTYLSAALVHCGENIIAGVNYAEIPEPPPTGTREVFMRTDLRYRMDDYIQWPQPGGYPHFAAILSKCRGQPHFDILWKDYHAHSEAFVTTTTHFVRLHPSDLSAFEALEMELSANVASYLTTPRSKSPESYRETILVRQGHAKTFLSRIKAIPMTRRELWRCLVEVQRFLLELHAALYWEVDCMPRILGLAPPATVVADTLGTFTSDPNVARQCVLAGLPVWMILDIDHLPDLRIDSVVKFDKAEGRIVLDEGTQKHPTIFKGKATNPRRLQEIYLNSRHVLHTADIFTTNYNPPAARSDAPRSMLSAQANADSLRGIQVSYHPYRTSHLTAEHRKNIMTNMIIVPPISHLLPSVLPAWLVVSKALDVKRDDFPTDIPDDAGFAFPNPAVFFDPGEQRPNVAPRNPQIKTPMVYHWLQLRLVMLFRVGPSVPSLLASPVSNRVWRRALQLEPPSFQSIRTSTSQKNNDKEKRDGLAFLEGSLQVAGETEALLERRPTWRGDEIADPQHISQHVWKEIIWEVSELNFRFELLALDRRLCPHPIRDEPQRQELLLDCVVPPPFARALIVVEFHQSTRGLAHPDIRQRLPQLLHLRKLMLDWKSPFSGFDNVTCVSDDAVLMRLEEGIYAHYFRQFFITFARVPVVPRYL